MTKRRLRVFDAVGQAVTTTADGRPTPHFEIDLSDLPNVNAACPYIAVIEEQCNLGHFHQTTSIPLPPWDDDTWKSQQPERRAK